MSPVVIDVNLLRGIQYCSYACTYSGKDKSSWNSGPIQPQQQVQSTSCLVICNHVFRSTARCRLALQHAGARLDPTSALIVTARLTKAV